MSLEADQTPDERPKLVKVVFGKNFNIVSNANLETPLSFHFPTGTTAVILCRFPAGVNQLQPFAIRLTHQVKIRDVVEAGGELYVQPIVSDERVLIKTI